MGQHEQSLRGKKYGTLCWSLSCGYQSSHSQLKKALRSGGKNGNGGVWGDKVLQIQ